MSIYLSFRRASTFALNNFWRNIWLSIITVFILVLTLLMLTVISTIKIVGDQAVAQVKQRVDVAIYFQPNVSQEKIQTIQSELQSDPRVSEVIFVSPDQALEDFRAQIGNNTTIEEALDALDENPLGATLVIKATNLDDYDSILRIFDRPENKELLQQQDQDLRSNQDVISRLSSLTRNISRIGYAIAAVFIVIAILVIFNTMRIAIYTHREEIGIMKLVGATNSFVRAPFLLESVLYGFLGAAITMAVFYPVFNASAPFLERFFAGYELNIIDYFNGNFLIIFGILLLFSIILSVLSSMIAIKRYLKV